VGQKERDDTKAAAASAKVVPLWPASIRDHLPTGYLEQVALRVRANLTDLVATADTYNLDLAAEFRIAAELLQKPSGTSHPLQVAESTSLSLTNGTGGCWELVDHRRDHATAVGYYNQAISAANRAGDTTAEAYARLRKSYVALYGEQEPQAGLRLAQEAATLADTTGSHALQGLALLHVGEGYAILGDDRACEAALGAAESHLLAMGIADPAHGLLSADRLGRIQGSCYLTLGDSTKAGSILESTARRLQGRHKSKAIVLGNLALAHVRQRDIDQATTVLHRGIDLLEVSRGGGGLNVVSAAVRELHPWRDEPVVQDVNERLLALMTLN
jgi:tetratricopeptide (TPR) repeat protein